MQTLDKARVLDAGDYHVEEQPWGRLTWFANAELGGADGMTVGECRIRPGCANPRHHHPNCEEVLHVLRGVIEHAAGKDGARIVMHPGQTIVVPAGTPHNARNIGAEDAVLAIGFSSPRRQTIGE